ncbi:aspartate carbamoyltransferase catalytic subunit [Marinihelvus fidelis]|uniref:Aspartate carbamoyltransferase n=1 Tax=Marinihelvus fidelis TaxID=2613842 RepID=A0A5N0TAX1_9GAMM|nr:aspartate carbamoyltransferase catalytic subunit [Marinihelvus fidelis]KAA9130956.1 aspartate carbamoyltransferase catalytic subunit [Marinihelvus fidelis]
MQHLIDITSTSVDDLEAILARASDIADDPQRYQHAGRDRVMINLFYEPSTRTRVSFELAAMRLGLRVINVAASDSSVRKGETLQDTFLSLQAMGPDCIAIRHPTNGALGELTSVAEPRLHIVNAGDGSRAHPTQALLDLFTLRRHLPDLENRVVLVAGDLHHSRVTSSDVALMKKLGVGEIRLCAPRELMAGSLVTEGVRVFEDFDAALEGVDAVMMLRIQHERLGAMDAPDGQDYHRHWGLTNKRLALAAPGCIVMHPGPMNRGVEIDSEVADGPRSVIREQVSNGVWVRMAVLSHLLGLRGAD